VAASIVGTERRRRRAEHLGPRVQRAGTEPRVGERHHVRAHARGLALPRRRHRPEWQGSDRRAQSASAGFKRRQRRSRRGVPRSERARGLLSNDVGITSRTRTGPGAHRRTCSRPARSS